MKTIEKGRIIQKSIALKEGVEVDRFGHVKYDRISEKGTKTYRYKLQKIVIRFEVKEPSTGTWYRIKTYNINKLYDGLKQKDLLVDMK